MKKNLKKISYLIQNLDPCEVEKNNHESISLENLLNFCMLIGNNSYEISQIFNFIDKENKNQIDAYELKLFLQNLLEFSLNEKKKTGLISTEETEENQENEIDNYINYFTERFNFEENNGILNKNEFITILMDNKDLKDELITMIRKTEDFIFSKVFQYNVTLNENKNHSKEDSKFFSFFLIF